ncbi:MAG: aldehyde dehydrogenase family protein [Verrucomicrobiae bacterium]|nr:aldehyde dehydrogenase family protein [Verrucomicrobiae bacterium]
MSATTSTLEASASVTPVFAPSVQAGVSPEPDIVAFLASPRPLLIDGEWVEAASGRTFDTFNPATGEVLARVAEADAEDVDRAVAAATRALNGPWGSVTPSDRSRMLWRFADLIEQHAVALATLESLDNGKPFALARHGDIPFAADTIRYMAGLARGLHGETVPLSAPFQPGQRFLAYTLKEPGGVVGQIIPWNFPILMAAWKLGPALAAGCTILLKPAEQTPLTALYLGQLALEAEIPPGVLNILPGYGETAGAAIAAHPGVAKVAFTGSTEVGRRIVQAAAGNLKKVTLELGGKSPNVILEDADVATATEGAAGGVFFNSGQVCTAGSRLFVHTRHFDQVVDALVAGARATRLGHGFDPQATMGPLVSREQLQRVSGYVDHAAREGARAAVGGRKGGSPGYYYEPTVLLQTNPGHRIVREEVFGPVVAAIPFREVEDVIAAANDTTYGLAAGVWTRDVQKAHRVAHALHAGTVWVNTYHVYDNALPFGGYKQSGWGRELGNDALENYTETKSVVVAL